MPGFFGFSLVMTHNCMLRCVVAVTRFARETGDVAALSSIDIKLLALAHTLEVAAHGSAHLAAHASQVRLLGPLQQASL